MQEKLEMVERQSRDIVEKYEKEIEMYNQVKNLNNNNMNNSVEMFPSNQHSTYS